MYGAGSIGRGFIGQLFGMSGYQTCFVEVGKHNLKDISPETVPVFTIATETGYKSQKINNVKAVNGLDTIAVAKEIASCEVMATAVGVNILPLISKTIASGIDIRCESGARPLDIIVCENITDGGKYLSDIIRPHVKNKEYFDEKVGFVSASVGRMVPVSTESDSSEIIVESYNELPVDADALKTDVSGIKNIIPVSPFAIEKYKKYFMHNMSHAIVAYMGFIKGYEFLWEAMGDDSIRIIAEKALEEIISAISGYFNADTKPLANYAADLLRRYANKYLNDTVARVGRDPKRKLRPNDRLAGAAGFCLKCGITPEYILYGIAAAFCFDIPADISSPEVIEYVRAKGIEAAVEEYTGFSSKDSVFTKIAKIYSIIKP